MTSTKKIIAANYLGQIWVAFIGLAFLPLFIKYLGVEAYGLVGIFTLLQTWLVLLDMGMTPTLNREMARFHAGAYDVDSIRGLLRTLEIVCIAVASLITLIVFLSSDWLASSWLKIERLQVEQVSQAIIIMSFVIGLRFVEGLYRGGLLGLHKQIWYNGANALISTIRNIGALFVVIVSPSIISFFIWQGIISLITVLSYGYKVNNSLPSASCRSRFSIKSIQDVWKFAGGIFGISILSLLLTQIDKLLLSKLITLESFAYYTLAATLAGVLFMIVGPIIQAIYPKIINYVTSNNDHELISLYHKSAQLITVVAGSIAVIVALYAKEIVYLWSGQLDLASKTATILGVLIIGNFFNTLMYLPYHLQLANGWTSLTLKTNFIAVCFLVPAIVFFVPDYGVIGAALIWCFLNAAYVLVSIQLMHRRLLVSEKNNWYFKDVIFPLIGPIVVCSVAYLFAPNFEDRFGWFLFFIVVGIASICASILFSGDLRCIARNYCVFYMRKFLSAGNVK